MRSSTDRLLTAWQVIVPTDVDTAVRVVCDELLKQGFTYSPLNLQAGLGTGSQSRVFLLISSGSPLRAFLYGIPPFSSPFVGTRNVRNAYGARVVVSVEPSSAGALLTVAPHRRDANGVNVGAVVRDALRGAVALLVPGQPPPELVECGARNLPPTCPAQTDYYLRLLRFAEQGQP
jgi:hypothetical protein